MPWFWGSSNGDKDPTKSLDPDLKQFLEEQQPKSYTPTSQPPKQNERKKEPIQQQLDPLNSQQTLEDRPLPKESLFQDGRYKHLWKTYVPQSEIENATVTPVERLISSKKDRRSAIHQAALENCAFEEQLQQDCLSGSGRSSTFYSTLTMCKAETKSYNRCYQLQAKFLQALGYMSSFDSTDEHEEKIQMHADKLYHRMMDYEEELETAKREGRPLPPLASLFDSSRPVPTLDQINLPQDMESKLKTPLKELPPHERELAARVALQESKVSNANAEEFFKYTTTMNEERKRRQAWATRIFGEAVGKFLIPDPPKPSSENGARDLSSNEIIRNTWHDEPSLHEQRDIGEDIGRR